MKKTKYAIDSEFATLKEMFKQGKGDTEEFDRLSREILDYLAELTLDGMEGDELIENIKLDLWKDRTWHLIERAGLLPEYNEIDEDEKIGSEDKEWYNDDEYEDWEFGEPEPILTKIER